MDRPEISEPQSRSFDVVIVGGAVSGASTAILLRRQLPHLSVLVVEKTDRFDWKVGESTVEISAYFLTRVLKQYDHLSREQLPKQAFRYWFVNDRVTCLREASEVGPTQLARTPSFQLDRSKLDEHLLKVAAEEGAEVWRPARVTAFELHGDAGNRLTVEREDGQRVEVDARWIVDATGRHAMLARKRGGVTPIDSHPISAIWVRYRGVKDMDGPEVAGTDPSDPFARAVLASRRLATNHFNGWGYWIWFIPLKDGETSVGLVWDKRLVEPAGRTPLEKLRSFLDGNPLARELLEHATPVAEDCRSYGHLPYFVDEFIGPGWTCVGDAGGFLDPFYSPGLDQMAFSVYTRVELMKKAFSGAPAEEMEKAYAEHNRCYARFFHYFYESIYKDKYYVMGDYDTMTAAFLLDTGLYYAAAIMPVYRWSHERLGFPPYFQDGAEIGYYPIRFYNRRLTAIAKRKKALGIYGNHNDGRRPGFVGFSVRSAFVVMIAHGLLRWWKAELANAWTYVSRPKPRADVPSPRAAVPPMLRPPHTAPPPARPLPQSAPDVETADASSDQPAFPPRGEVAVAAARGTALVTGASSGIGREIAKLLAADHYDLVLVARGAKKLEELGSELAGSFGVQTRVAPHDLAQPAGARDLLAEIDRSGISIDILVNNAGLGLAGPFAQTDGKRDLEVIQVNVTAVTELAKGVLPGMLRRRAGRILNVASTAAFQPGPLMAVYYASKAYVLSFSEAIANELDGTGVTVTALCPGPTATEFQRKAGLESSRLFAGPLVMDAESVARAGYSGMMRGKRLVIPGFANKAMVQALRVSPRRLVIAIARRLQESRAGQP